MAEWMWTLRRVWLELQLHLRINEEPVVDTEHRSSVTLPHDYSVSGRCRLSVHRQQNGSHLSITHLSGCINIFDSSSRLLLKAKSSQPWQILTIVNKCASNGKIANLSMLTDCSSQTEMFCCLDARLPIFPQMQRCLGRINSWLPRKTV